jgi:small subunit ribosomal protein S20
MCATMQKLRMREVSVLTVHPWYGRHGSGEHARTRGPSSPEAAGTLVGRMANIKSQIKRNKQNEVRRERNKAVRSTLKTSQKKVQAALDEGDANAARDRAREASRALDKAASKGVVHKRTAARRKSRLARAANALGAE